MLWQQDMLYQALAAALARRRIPARAATRAVRRVEGWSARQAHRVVCISPTFVEDLQSLGVTEPDFVPNWAPLDDFGPTVEPTWAQTRGLAGKTIVLYAGTLGMKHNPDLLVELARAVDDRDDVRVVVVSTGPGADHIKLRVEQDGIRNVLLLPFQPFQELPSMLASASLTIALLEESAGTMSVPSKILTYLAAGRAVLAGIPTQNHAADVIAQSGAGVVVPPTDIPGFVSSAVRLLGDTGVLAAMGAAGRRYAESEFGITSIADRFEEILAVTQPAPGSHTGCQS